MREVGGFRNSDLSVSSDQLRFGLTDVGPPLQQIGRKAWRDLWRMRLLRQLCSARDGTGIVSQKRAYEVFLLLNPPFQIGNGLGGSEYELFRLPDVEHGCSPTVC